MRILGEVKKDYANLLRRADAIFIEELRSTIDVDSGKSWYDLTSQAFAVFLPVKSVGVMGDGRTFEFVVALRAVQTSDFMTADWAELPYALLKKFPVVSSTKCAESTVSRTTSVQSRPRLSSGNKRDASPLVAAHALRTHPTPNYNRNMKVCIVGAGAIGSCIGAKIAHSRGAQVSALARGDTLRALKTFGWRMQAAKEVIQAPVHASASAEKLGQQDVVILAVKGQALTSVARDIAPLLGAETIVVPAMNGVPWWFCAGLPGFEQPLDSVDPGGVATTAISRQRVVGCVVHFNAAVVEPGLVQHRAGNRLIIGEATGGSSERVTRLADVLSSAGFEVLQSANVRYDIWYKLWGNLTMNPVSALTGATIDKIQGDPLVKAFCSRAMREAALVGASIGCSIDQTPDDRHAITARLGAFKTSMLQDVEARRPIELDGIVTVVYEIARRQNIDTPAIDALLGLTRLFGRQHGLYPDG